MTKLKKRVIHGAFWAGLEKLSIQLVGFVVTLVLARLLSPTDYGTVALLALFISIASTLADAGFGESLVQTKEATEEDFNTVFYFSTFVSFILYGVLWFSAPAIADFYKTDELRMILRVVAIVVPLHAINSVQMAELNRRLMFNISFRVSLISGIISAIIGITMAIGGYGPWALVAQTVSGALLSVGLYWFFIKWRPRLIFSFSSLRRLFGFGWKLAISSLLDGVYNNVSGLIIGKFYAKEDLAFVDKGRVLPSSMMTSINGSIERVTFPVLSNLQEEPSRVKDAMRRVISVSSFFVFPLMTILAVCAPRLILILFGENWAPAVPYMQLVCFQFALRPFHSVNLRAILAMGKSDIFLRLEVVKKVIGLALLAISLPYGVLAFVATSCFVASPIGVIINSWPNRKLLGYTIIEQIRDVLPSILACAGVAAICTGLSAFIGESLLNGLVPSVVDMMIVVIIQGGVGILVYASIAWYFKFNAFEELKGLFKGAF